MAQEVALEFTSADGSVLEFSTTSKDPARRATVEEVLTKDGTGFESMTVGLKRDPTQRYDDVLLLERARAQLADGKTVFEGAITGRVPESNVTRISATGDFSVLKDRSGYSEIFRDQDAASWREASVDRKLNLAGGSSVHDKSPDNDGGWVRTALPAPPWTAAGTPRSTAVYRSPAGAYIGRVEGDWVRGADAIHTAATYQWLVSLGDDELFGGTVDGTGDLQAAGPGTFGVDATTRTRQFAEMVLDYPATYGTADTNDRSIAWKPVVYGLHGLSSITPSTVIKSALASYAPAIAFDSESITDHFFEIAQLVFDAVDLTEVVARVNAYANWDFGVWEGSRAWYGPAADLNREQYILDPAGLDSDGRSVSTDYPVNGVEVFYNNVLTGRVDRVGPNDDYRLRDENPENPCNRQKRTRWGKLQIPFPADQATAIQIGAVWLAEHLIPSRSGEGRVQGKVLTSTGQLVPCAHIRAGDVVRYSNESIGRKVYATRWSPGDDVNKLTYSDAAATLDAILERIGIRLTLISGKGL